MENDNGNGHADSIKIGVQVDGLDNFIIETVRGSPGIRLNELVRLCDGASYNQVRARVLDLDAKRILLAKRIRWKFYIYVRPEVSGHD